MDYKTIINRCGLKHCYIADKIGVSKSFLSKCLSGKKRFPKEREDQLRKILQLN